MYVINNIYYIIYIYIYVKHNISMIPVMKITRTRENKLNNATSLNKSFHHEEVKI